MSKTQAKTSVTVSTAANIALIKYWGKLEQAGNQPATASLSIGLEGLRTTTTLSFSNSDCDQGEFCDFVNTGACLSNE